MGLFMGPRVAVEQMDSAPSLNSMSFLVLRALSIPLRALLMMAVTPPVGFAWELTEIYMGLVLTVVTLTWAPFSASLQRGC
jgi:hypothetical protein